MCVHTVVVMCTDNNHFVCVCDERFLCSLVVPTLVVVLRRKYGCVSLCVIFSKKKRLKIVITLIDER